MEKNEEIDANKVVSGVKTVTSICSKKVLDSWIKTKKVGSRPELKYIPIDKTIRFLNENFGDNWESEVTHLQAIMVGPFLSITTAVKLTINGVSRTGIGSDIGIDTRNGVQNDADKISKTSIANGLKKATNQFGYGLELWDEDNIPDEEDENDIYRSKIDTCIRVLGWTEINLKTYIKSLSNGKISEWSGLSLSQKEKVAEKLVEKCKIERETDVK